MSSITTNPKSDHELFEELFVAVRICGRTEDGQPNASHNALLEFAQQRGWKWAINLAAALFKPADKLDDVLALLNECEKQVPWEYVTYVYFVRGTALGQKRDYEGAVKDLRKAIARPGHANQGRAWTNLGVVLGRKGELNEAIDAHNKALAEPGYETPGHAWNNLGNALARKLDFNGAIAAYHKALAKPGYDTPGYALNNLGNAHYIKGNLQAAVDAYQKALAQSGYDRVAGTWASLANTYAALDRIDLARDACEKALAASDKIGIAHSRARLILRMLPKQK